MTQTQTPARTTDLTSIARAKTILLTTYRRDGSPVSTPVHVAAIGDVLVVRTFDPSGKLKRIRRNPDVEIAACTARGRVTGEACSARARVLDGEESEAAARAMAHRYPIVHRFLIPWFHRRKGLVTTQLELTRAD